MIARRVAIFVFVALAALSPKVYAATYFVAPEGNDTASGAETAPFATIMRAQSAASAGDTVYLRGGTYALGDANITRTDSIYAYVNDFTKSGISYLSYPGETPVFDFSAVKPAARRVTAFFLRANNLLFAGFQVAGVQVTIKTGEASNTQSENFRITNGSGNTLERLVLRDGMGIGVYITGASANNLVLNCDAYNNAGLDSLSMGNVDGFGAHTSASGSGNVFRGCRAWLNSDDGFDLINCQAATVIENCWAAFNGYVGTSLATGADGNGFKAGGYGKNGSAMPNPMPRHAVRFSLAVRNRASGFYANHHGGGLDFVHDTAFQNATNYNLLNVLADNLTDVPGYDHYLKNNLGFSPRSTSVSNLDQAACDVSYNFFTLPVTVTSADFVSTTTNTAQLLAIMATPRQADGSLPAIDLLRLANGSDVIDVGLPLAGFAFNQVAPDLGCFENGFVPAPSGLSAAPGDNSVALSWTASPGENRYTVARGVNAAGPFAVIATDLAGAAYADGTAVNGTTYHYVVAAYNRFGSSAYSGAVSAKPLGPVAKWIGGFFADVSDPTIIGPAADPDGDGLPNLLEYFFGANPATSDLVSPLRLERNGGESGEAWVLRFLAAKEAPGVSYRIEASSDLVAWAEDARVPTVEGETSGRWNMRVDLGESVAGTFWRLRVTQTGG